MKVFILTLLVIHLRVAHCEEQQCSKDDDGNPCHQASGDNKWSGDASTVSMQEDIAQLRAGQAQIKDALSDEMNKNNMPGMRDDIDYVKHGLSQLSTLEDKVKILEENLEESKKHKKDRNKESDKIKHELEQQKGQLQKCNNEISKLHASSEELEMNLNDKFARSLETRDESLKTVQEQMKESVAETKLLNKSLSQLEKNLNKEEYKLAETINGLEAMKKEVSEISSLEEKYDHEMNVVKHNCKKMTESVRHSLIDELEKQNDVIRKVKDDVHAGSIRVSQTNTELEEIKRDFSKQLDDTKQMSITEIEKVSTTAKEALQEGLGKEHDLIIEVQTELHNFKSNISEAVSKLVKETHERIHDVKTFGESLVQSLKTELHKELHKLEDHLKTLKAELDKEHTYTSETFAKFERSMTSMSKQIEDNKRKLESRIDDAENEGKTHVRTVQKALLEQIGEQQDKVNIIYPNTFNKESVSMAGVVVVCWLFLLTVVVLVVIWGQGQKAREIKVTLGKTSEEEESRPKELQNNVLLISYDADMTSEYRDMITTATATCGDVGVVCYNIQQEQQLADIPASKICIMFVEYSERHVIIETPGLGLGSLKRKTLEAARRNGSCVVIIYARDPGSRSLQSHQRYNTDISCVTSQPELLALDDVGTFFSVYSQLTEFQTNCLRDIVSRKLCR